MDIKNYIDYYGDFLFTKAVSGFYDYVNNMQPTELYLKYLHCEIFIKSIDKSVNYAKYLIWKGGVDTPVGFFIYSVDDNCLINIYIEEEYRRLGLYKKSLSIIESEFSGIPIIQSDSKSEVNSYLINNGYVIVNSFIKIMSDDSIRKEYCWKKFTYENNWIVLNPVLFIFHSTL